MTTSEIISLCALCLSAIVGLFAILTFVRNGNKETKTEVKETTQVAEMRGYEKGVLSAKLDAISSGIESIRDEIKGVKGSVVSLEQRVVKLESRVITLEREMHEVRKIQGSATD